jgi:GT2 family glycosyltransferase
VINKVGYLDCRMFYHVDADYCKRIADAGYQNYYLPNATVIHLNHKGGTMVSLRLRVRSLFSFHVDCYVYYCKHMQRWAWSPMRLVILAAIAANFVALLTVRLAVELVGAVRSVSRQKRAVT